MSPATNSNASPRRKSSPEKEKKENDGGFSMDDLGLMHHFVLYTSLVMDPMGSFAYQEIWQVHVPCVAQQHPFLMHAVLGFAAAHKASLETGTGDDFVLLQTARHHYSKALVLFRTSVREINPEQTANALLCYLILVCFLTLFLEFDKPEPERCGIEDLLSLLTVLHGSIGVLANIRQHLNKSEFGVLLSHARPGSIHPHAAASDVKLSLGQLEGMVVSRYGPFGMSSESTAIIDAIGKLMRMYTLTCPEPEDWAHILVWPILLGEGNSSQEFLGLLERKHPAALCVAAHWAVAAYNAPWKWHVADWPERLLRDIAKSLDGSEWFVCMEWPLMKTLGKKKRIPNTGHDVMGQESLSSGQAATAF
ncbi:Sterol uptake control protein 2 [Pseudocercospora fuligena]|uniref:Sterol uptake control protein 2 n=1 Tax=Pseudocercospora fuligena TaxID=685502 RepID=A0A8H6R7M6_9PEZI|nr:Sterol uptake control protein 2 [Pseudocercospora fuligena]